MPSPKHKGPSSDAGLVLPTITHGERYSDAGNARRLVRLFGDSIRWVPAVDWFWFDGTRWLRGADAPIQTFVDRARREASNDLARLAQLRFVCASELEEERPLAESLVKTVTGGEAISARFLYGEYFEFQPTFKVWIACNHKPRISGDDHGIWRRIRLTPLRVTIPPEEQDRELLAKLRRELPGILNWAISGALAWQRDGLGAPPAVLDATRAYRDESDTIGGWIDERCVQGPHALIQAKPLYLDYARYINERGGRPLSMKRWAQRMSDRGFTKDEGRIVKYRGIALCDLATIDDHYS